MESQNKRVQTYVELLTDELRQDWSVFNRVYPLAEASGWHILPVGYYSTIPTWPEIEAVASRRILPADCPIDFAIPNQLAFLKVIREFAPDLSRVPLESNQPEYYWNNGMFGFQDATLYYSIIRKFQPRRIVEVGCGMSTLIAAEAAEKNPSTEIVAIEPYPDQFHNSYLLTARSQPISLIAQKVQDVDLEIFEALDSGDILFIDNSHVARAGSDVNYLFFSVLPRLRPGVLVHLHDIFLPYEYPMPFYESKWFFNEQYMLASYLMHNEQFSVFFANCLISRDYEREYLAALNNVLTPSGRLAAHPQFSGPIFGGSFWLRRNADRNVRETNIMTPTETSNGYCHVCGGTVTFASYEPLDLPCKRNTFICPTCGSSSRNRHLAATILDLLHIAKPDGALARADDLAQFAENWSGKVLLTCTSGPIHSMLARHPGCTASEYIDDTPSGATREGVLCQDLQRTSFEDDFFDLIVTEDVMEHIPNPEQAYAEIRRILKPGGYHIATIPVNWSRIVSARRATIANGEVVHFMPPEYHGDPTRAEGILAFTDYGHDLIDKYLTITGPSWMLTAHGDRKMEQEFGIFNSWVFVSQKRKAAHQAASQCSGGR